VAAKLIRLTHKIAINWT